MHFYEEGSPVWDFVGGKGFYLDTVDGMIFVNMIGNRFFSESDTSNDDFIPIALSSVILDEGTGHTQRLGGPIWSIFDADFVKRNGISVEQPEVDIDGGYFFSGDTLEELAANIVNKYYENVKMDPDNLLATVESYNIFVDAGADSEFDRDLETMTKKIENGPFYAAWQRRICMTVQLGLLQMVNIRCF